VGGSSNLSPKLVRAGFSHFPLYHPGPRDEGLEPHYVGEKYWFAKVPRDVNKTVDISDYIDRKIDALCAHECQMEMTVMDLQVSLAATVPSLRHSRGWSSSIRVAKTTRWPGFRSIHLRTTTRPSAAKGSA